MIWIIRIKFVGNLEFDWIIQVLRFDGKGIGGIDDERECGKFIVGLF